MIDLTKPVKEVIETIIRVCTDGRRLFTKEWAKNNRRLAGFTAQDVYINDAQDDSGEAVPGEPTDTQYVTSFNRTRGFFQRLLGRLMPAITNYQVLAASDEDEDKDAAGAGGELLESRTSVDSGRDFEESCRAMSYLFAGGPAYLRIEGNENISEVEVESVLPFDVYYYPGIKQISQSPAIVLVERMTQQDIERRFPELADEIEAHGKKNEEGGWKALQPAKWPDEVHYDGISGNIGDGMFTVKRLIIKPCADFLKGKQYAMVDGLGDVKATWEDIGTADGEYPLEALADIPMGPFYEDRGRMSISSPMQRVFDIAISKMVQLGIGSPQQLVNLPPGCGVTADDWTNKATVISTAPDALKPTVQQVDTLGQLPDLAQIASGAMDEVHSQHGPSRGQMPGARTSGKALEEVIQADMAMDEPLMAMMRRSMARVGKRILMEGQRVWDDEYIFHVLGKNKRFQAKKFRGAQLKEGFAVRVLPDQGLPKNKVARMKMVAEFQKQGLLSDTIEGRRARDMIGSPVDDDLYAAQPAEEQLIRMEEEKLGQGVEVGVNWSDDHMMHRMRHRARNTERLALGRVDEIVLRLAMEHDKMHEIRLQEEMQAMLPPAGPEGAPQ